MVLQKMWDKCQKEGVKLDYHFSKNDFRVPPEVRQDICEMTQLPNISRLEIRPKEDNLSVCFKVSENKNEARKLVGALCSMLEVWRHHNDIVVSVIPNKLYYRKAMCER